MVAAYAPTDVESLAIERQYIPSHIPLIKTVWAVGGEKICHMPSRLIVQNRPALVVLTHDSQGRKLPFRQGCYTLGDDELFLVSTDVQTSFDSRYFGPVPVSDLLGPVQYLGRFKGRGERIRAGHG
jgi:type IV secretory pathway protease TraF